jgi:hypothetical protein
MSGEPSHRTKRGGLRRGDIVTVRSLPEILGTLDKDAKYEGLPFMPEMVPFCGKTFHVFRRAEKTCVEGTGMRVMRNTVFLQDLRCDGSAHEGCERGCLFFWKEAWLNPAEDHSDESQPVHSSPPLSSLPSPLALNSVSFFNDGSQLPTTRGDRFYCQSTELAGATEEFPPGKWGHYLHDFRVGEITFRRFGYFLWMALANRVWRLLHGRGVYQLFGEKKKTRAEELNLQPGELVEIKSMEEIRATLDDKGRNRGLSFEPEMALLCGRRYRVAKQVKSIIAEESGKMVRLGNTVILEGLTCQGICTKNCPRANFFYWREIWLKRV